MTPLLKKLNLKTDILTNYWPVSNLPFLANLLEKVVRITSHADSNHMVSSHQSLQSAYRRFHSTEPVLLCLLSDLTATVKACNLALLALLDRTAMSDTIDHQILLEWLDKTFGIFQDALKWISSYLSGHMQSVVMSDSSSQLSLVKYGVHKTMFGPLLFILYTGELDGIIYSQGSHLTAMQMTASCSFSADQMSRTSSSQVLWAASAMSQTRCHPTD